MPEISRFYGIIIRMYYSDHNPPHLHAIYQGQQIEVDIKTLDILAGNFPRRAYNLVLEWATINREQLLDNWGNAQVPQPISKIKPLE